jgi:hypothetical protein
MLVCLPHLQQQLSNVGIETRSTCLLGYGRHERQNLGLIGREVPAAQVLCL